MRKLFALFVLWCALFPPIVNGEPQTGNQSAECKPNSADYIKCYRQEMEKPDILPIWIGSVAAVLASIAGLVTLGFLYCQTTSARKAADAALLQANHIATSERAWLTAEISQPPLDFVMNPQGKPEDWHLGIEVKITNQGKVRRQYLTEVSYPVLFLLSIKKAFLLYPICLIFQNTNWIGEKLRPSVRYMFQLSNLSWVPPFPRLF
jgi:hypothetical protein